MTEEQQAAVQAQIAERKKQDQDEAISFVLSTERGRAFVWEMLARTGLFGASFSGEATHQTAFNEGKRQIGAQLFADVLHAQPTIYTVMRSENIARQDRYHVTPPQENTDEN